MNSVADIETGTVTVVIEIDAPPAVVFDALIDPRKLALWWGDGEAYRTYDWNVDPRSGGRWSCHARNASGEESTVGGEYLTVREPHTLEFTWKPSWEEFLETVVRIEIEAMGRESRVTLIHSGFGDRTDSCREHAEGWKVVLGWLSGFVGSGVEGS